jgi:hypothetical protein
MRELSNIEESLQQARMQERLFYQRKPSGKSIGEIALAQPKGDLLFFPRKKLRMQKIKSGNWEPRAWFIQDRLNERATDLDRATDISYEGLTSGLRSAIVKESNGTYLRLKGVAPKIYESQRRRPRVDSLLSADLRGLSSFSEAFDEQGFTLVLNEYNFPFLSMKPGYIEFFFLPCQSSDSSAFISQYHLDRQAHFNFQNKGSFTKKIKVFEKLHSLPQDYQYGLHSSFVSAFEVSGDTRLDEALYELTKVELDADKRVERDELVHYLAFNAGSTLGHLTAGDYIWSARLDATNSHLGNFVLDNQKGRFRVTLADLGAVQSKTEFGDKEEFWNHVYQDIELFRDDFFADYTTSHPTSLKFKYFPEELRESAFQAFKTGYSTIAKYVSEQEITPMGIGLERIVVPDKTIMTTQEARESIKRIMG